MAEDNSDGEKTLKEVMTPGRSVDNAQALMAQQISEVLENIKITAIVAK
jgi:urease gamma subunit